MILIGRDLSPFVRRSATVLNLLGLACERRIVATEADGDYIRRHNPLGRVPALLLFSNSSGDDAGEDKAEVIVDSSAIIDYALETADNSETLLAASGAERRRTLYLSAIATGTMEKGVASAYELNMRPKEYVYPPYRERCLSQVMAGLQELETRLQSDWFGANVPSLADVNAVVAYDFIGIVAPELINTTQLPGLAALSERANSLPAFAQTRWQPPGDS